MTPRGQDFLLSVAPNDSTLDLLVDLESQGLHPTAALRRGKQLYLSLSSPSSTQRVAEIVGPSLAVTLADLPLDEPPPATDWLMRLIGPRTSLEGSMGQALSLVQTISKEIGGTDTVRMGLSGIDPCTLDLRISTNRHTEFSTRRVGLLNLAERLELGALIQRLTLFKKPKGLVCFDLDSTLVSEELIIEVAKRVGKEQEVEEITRRAMAGELDYERSFIRRVALLRGLREEALEDIWRSLRPQKEVAGLLTSLRMRDIRTAILSGAFTYFTERTKERLGMDFAIGNEIGVEDGMVTGNVKGEIVTGPVKLRKMREFAAQLNLTLDQVVAIGDGANDVEIIREAGTGIAYDRAGVVKYCADGLLPAGQLGNLLFLIGP